MRSSRTPTIGASSSRGLGPSLDDHSVSQTARLADHLEAEAAVALLQRIEKRRGQSSPGRAQRMAKGDGSPVDVDLAEIGPDLAGPRQHHRGERLVDLEQVDVSKAEPRAGQQLAGSRDDGGE